MKNNIVIYQETDLSARTHIRAGEYKLGEKLLVMKPGEGLGNLIQYATRGVQYVLLGIPESFDSMADFTGELEQVLSFFKGFRQPVGIEMDMDSLVNMPSSARTPSGFTVEEARKFIRAMALNLKCAYVHLPEGAPSDNSDEMIKVGKTLAYLIADFIRFNSR